MNKTDTDYHVCGCEHASRPDSIHPPATNCSDCGNTGRTNALVKTFNALKCGDTVMVAMTSCMGTGRVTNGSYHAWTVGRRSTSKRWGRTSVTLLPPNGPKPTKYNRFALHKRRGQISASHGDMAMFLKGIKR